MSSIALDSGSDRQSLSKLPDDQANSSTNLTGAIQPVAEPVIESPGCCGGRCPFTNAQFCRVLGHLFLFLLLVTCIFLVIFFWETLREVFVIVIDFLGKQADSNPLATALILTAANILAALLFLPCIPFTLSAGALFGLWKGVIIISIASIIAASLAFLCGRYLARSVVEKNLGTQGSKWRIIDNAINSDGLKFVFLLRLSPLAPFSPMNYLFGLSSVRMSDYVIASFFGMLPTTIMEVYSGETLGNLDEIINGHGSSLSGVIFWVGLGTTVIVTTIITVWVRRKLKFELERYEDRSLVVSASDEVLDEVELSGLDFPVDDDDEELDVVVVDDLESDPDDDIRILSNNKHKYQTLTQPKSKSSSSAKSSITSIVPTLKRAPSGDKSDEQKAPNGPTRSDLEQDYSYVRRDSQKHDKQDGVKSRRTGSRQSSPVVHPTAAASSPAAQSLSSNVQQSPSSGSRTLLIDHSADSEDTLELEPQKRR